MKLDLRYTSYLEISSLNIKKDINSDLFKSLETLRQRNIREARRACSFTVNTGDGKEFVELYDSMMRSKNEYQSKEKLMRLKRLIDGLVDCGKAEVYMTKNSDNKIIYATVFGWDNKRSYYLFGAPVENSIERYKGTIAFWDVYIDLAKKGIDEVDLEGVNSPQRGWFKLSFGGNILPYYHVSKKK